jgi:prolyl 4-hydroxylase
MPADTASVSTRRGCALDNWYISWMAEQLHKKLTSNEHEEDFTPMPRIDAEWEKWLVTNVGRGCGAESIIESMVQAGFDHLIAQAAVRQAISGTESDTQQSSTSVTPREYAYDPSPIADGNVIHAYDRDVGVLMRCERPQVIVFKDVLSTAECTEIIERSRHRLKRSTIVDPETGREDIIRNRTSEGISFQRGEDKFIERLDLRIASLMNWPMENGEGLQVLHYETGGEYKPHFDYFPPNQAGSGAHTASSGQRVATLIVYLNDVPNGGATIFPAAGISVSAMQGCALYFRYLNGLRQLDPLTLHGGKPVLTGDKWIMTKWVRERAYV